MARTAWEKAKELVSHLNIRKLTSNDLHLLNIRQLKLVAQAINAAEGLIISKPQFGKTLSNMRKAELINAIWHWRKTLMDCPDVPDEEWRDGRLSINVVTTSVQGALWTTSVGFDTEQEAYKFYQTACHKWWCRMACLREGKRTGFKWEVKLWDISPELFAQLQPQEHSTLKVETKAMIEKQPLTTESAEIPTTSHPNLVEIYKPNGAYRFVDGATMQMLCSVYTKTELNCVIEKYLNLGCQVHCHDPKTSQIYLCKMVNGKIKYSPIFIEAAVSERQKAAFVVPTQPKKDELVASEVA